MIRLLVAILLLAAAPAWAQNSSTAAQSPAVSAQALAQREQALATRTAAIEKRETEEAQRRALLDARAAIEDASHSRLEIILGILGGIIGLFSVLITVIVLVLAFRTERSAIIAAVQAAKDEIKTEREEIARVGREAQIVADGAKAELAQQRSDVNAIIEDIRRHRTNAENMSADLQKAVSAALSGTRASTEQAELLKQANADIGDKAIRDLTESEFEVRIAAAGANGAYQTLIDLAVTMRQLFPSDRVQVSALFAQGWALGELNRPAEAVAVYDDLIARFGDSDQTALREQFANVMFNKGLNLGRLGQPADEIAAYDDLISRFGTSDQPALRKQVAMALVNKGVTLSQLDQPADEIAAYDDLISRFGSSDQTAILEEVAIALINKGVSLGQLGSHANGIAAYEDLIARFGTSDVPTLREQVAQAINYKGISLIKLGRPADATAVFDDLIARHGTNDEPALRKNVASAFFNKSCALAFQGHVIETIATLRLWAERTGKFDCDAVQTDTDFEPIRADPAFVAFMAEMGCAPAQPG